MPAISSIEGYSFRSAHISDAETVAEIVDAAYRQYVERIGMLPGPMTDDYAEVIRSCRVTLVEWQHSIVVGVIALRVTEEGFLIDNVAVHPSHQGKGVGWGLLVFAEREAGCAGFDSVHLYTHEKMTENLGMYSKAGYVEYDRRLQGDFSLVYMRKALAPACHGDESPGS